MKRGCRMLSPQEIEDGYGMNSIAEAEGDAYLYKPWYRGRRQTEILSTLETSSVFLFMTLCVTLSLILILI